MNERGRRPEHGTLGPLRDAAATHETPVGAEPEAKKRRGGADLIGAIIAGVDSARRG